ncbi:CHAT domain-containing protein [Planktothrix agardhii]|jgi:CHAT domain-containing protein|uniref:CHAT domain-containing protein n=1 Tax=Planktothrix agardhii TaxID=1160 RepID=UPI0020A7783C|nr:CHAT domain-containing protein [Planktothrix agardhii]CAD5945552.1 Tetratricopeptide repeat protein 28 [Planktothrix agardhii]
MHAFKKVSSFLFLMMFGCGLIGAIYFLFNFKPNPARAIIDTSTTAKLDGKNETQTFKEVCEIYKDKENLLNLATNQKSKDDYEKAIKSLEVPCKNDKFEESQIVRLSPSLAWIAELYSLSSDYKKAVNVNKNLIDIIDSSNNNRSFPNKPLAEIDYNLIELKQQKIAALDRLGNTAYLMGNYAQSKRYYYDALQFNKENKENESEIEKVIQPKNDKLRFNAIKKETQKLDAILNGDMGNVYHSIGKYDQAISSYEKRLKSLDELIEQNNINGQDNQELLTLKGSAYGSLGDAYYSQYSYNKNNQSYNNQKNSFPNDDENDAKEICKLKPSSELENKLIDYDIAVCYFKERLETARSIKEDQRGEAIALGQLAMASHGAKKINQSLKKNISLEDPIDYYLKRLVIATKIKDQRLIGSTYGGLAYIYQSNKKYDNAIQFAKEYLEISGEIGDQPGLGAAQNLLGVLHLQRYLQPDQKQKNDLDDSIEYLKQAMETKEKLGEELTDVEQVFLTDTQEQQNVYFNLQQAYVKAGKVNEALEIAERGRAKALVKNLFKQLNLPSKALTSSDIQNIANQQQATLIVYSIIPNPINENKPLLYSWVIKPNSKSIKFYSFNADIESRLKDKKIPNFNPSQRILSDEDRGIPSITMVTFLRSVIVKSNTSTSNAKNPEQQPPDKEISKKILSAYYDLLIRGIEKDSKLNKDSKLIFIPQKELFQIPFAALYDQDKSQYLIEKHPILMAPSIKVLDLIQLRKNERKKNSNSSQNKIILGINNPTPGKICDQEFPLSPLNQAEKESQEIAKILRWDNSKDSLVTKSDIKSRISNAGIIHFATHGILSSCEEQEAIPGALAFNQDKTKTDNGWLTAREIAYSQLQAELMVLSACDTAGGRLTADGVLGLSRSAIVGGASSTIVSLWRINDQATAHLMIEFYKQLKNQKTPSSKTLDLAEALRKAMIETKKDPKFSNPYNWSAFTLIGESTIDAEMFSKE